jgi:predicted anti-sigma-YlaC factor YlaD
MDAYHQGSLAPADTDRVKEHLVLCRECRDQFLELVKFLEDDGSEGRVWSGEIAAVWQDWWAAMKEQEETGSSTTLEGHGRQ